MKIKKWCDECEGSGYVEIYDCKGAYEVPCSFCEKGYIEIDIPIEQCLEALKEAELTIISISEWDNTPRYLYEAIKAAEEFINEKSYTGKTGKSRSNLFGTR